MENYTFEEYKEESFNDNPQLKEIYEMELLNHFIWAEIRKIRIQKWLSQNDLAIKIHSTQSVIARIESGKANISMKTLWRLSAWLGARISFIA
ncbi:MAG: hypothetical protein ACD_3C00067G0001 [uncultured bacterium (gcode 4)]|uniref:HTH cro/C1-type domain-containing protein n=1 Tax=uncultured bacterium (gcode 4) TaxID=1234023 RepID=K2G284_9BACT|nr:MAG: hypothetical protein ACD_3C00067G0001 [uncultured bacterium (gcode 4)]